jgi:hypothetical protein
MPRGNSTSTVVIGEVNVVSCMLTHN